MPLTFDLVDVAGVVHPFDDSTGVQVAVGSKGLGFPTVQPSGDKLPYGPGVALRRISTPPSVLDVPLYIEATSSALLDTLLDTLRGWLMPGTERNATPSTVWLRITRADGAQREIEGVYTGGLEGDDLAGVEIWQDAVISLYCHEPYWRDISATVHTFTSGSGLRTWFPLYPYDLSPSAVFAEETITNSGQIEAWPVWTITGPGTNPTLTNVSTGEVTQLALTLAAGDVVTIDTTERAKTIRNQLGANLWPNATPDTVLWPLDVGANTVQVAMSGTTVDSAVSLSYRRRWAGGHR